MGNSDEDYRQDGRQNPSRGKHRYTKRRSHPSATESGRGRRSSNSSFYDCQSLPRLGASCVAEGVVKPSVPPNVLEVCKKSGPMSRPLSKECLSPEGHSPPPIEEDEVAHFDDSEMLIAEQPLSTGLHYSGPFDVKQDSGIARSHQSFSPCENSGSLDGMTEHRRNRANLQMSQQVRMESAFNESRAFEKNSAKAMELRSKQRKLEGKRRIQYDRNFLLQLRFGPKSLQRPVSLPSLPEIILDLPFKRNERVTQSLPRKPFNDFTMNFARPTPVFPIRSPGVVIPNLRMPAMLAGSGRTVVRRFSHPKEQQQQQPPRKVIQVSLQQTVQLHTSENAWKPVHKKELAETDFMNEELYRKVRGILNKLTPQKFQTLIQQVHELDINTEEKLKGCIDLIFEKAISEPNFSVAYANMAKCLINLKVPTEENPTETVTFRKLLLNRCQREFEKDKLEEIDLEHLQSLIDLAETDERRKFLTEAKEQAEAKAKKRSLGNIRFIGELYKLKMLTENIMHDCIIRLLRYSLDEDNLECLSRLLTTIGQDIDNEKSHSRVDQYMHQLKKIVGSRRISSRIRFMLQDLMELRENGWIPRHEDNKPKTIEQIHKEAEQEEQQKLLHRTSQEQRASFRRPRTPIHSSSVSEEGWNGVPNNTVDAARMKLTKHQVEDLQLGPGGRPGYSTWQRGSSGGGNQTSSVEREKQSRHGSNDNHDFRNYSRTIPRGKGLALRSMEKDRNAAIAAVRSIAAGKLGEPHVTPTNSRSASRDSSCNREMTHGSHSSSEFVRGPSEFGRVPIILSRRSNNLSHSGVELSGDTSSRKHGSVEVDQVVANRMGDAGPKLGKGSKRTVHEMSQKDIEKKSKSILKEYLQIYDLEEASICMSELQSSRAVTIFITEAINFALERSSEDRKQLGRLFANLVKKKQCTLDHLVSSFQEVLRYAEDIEIDIPKIWQYLGELMAATVSGGTVPLRLVQNFCKPLASREKMLTVVAVIIEVITKTLGKEQMRLMWEESQLFLKDFVPENKLEQFVRNQNLAWLEPNSVDSSENALSSEMDKMIFTTDTENEDIISWIKANISPSTAVQPQFIRALMTSVCKSALKTVGKKFEIDVRQLKHRVLLLGCYLKCNVALEVQALYALQSMVHNLEHPPNMLRTFFDVLYDEEIISEEAFNQWYNCDDAPPGDQAGKGVARTSVNHFFLWLHGEDL